MDGVIKNILSITYSFLNPQIVKLDKNAGLQSETNTLLSAENIASTTHFLQSICSLYFIDIKDRKLYG
jgi:hypothetical protein